MKGFEPSISRATTWCLKPLGYTHQDEFRIRIIPEARGCFNVRPGALVVITTEYQVHRADPEEDTQDTGDSRAQEIIGNETQKSVNDFVADKAHQRSPNRGNKLFYPGRHDSSLTYFLLQSVVT